MFVQTQIITIETICYRKSTETTQKNYNYSQEFLIYFFFEENTYVASVR